MDKKIQKEDPKTKEEIKSDVAKREEEVLAFWDEHDIFNKSLEKEAPNGEYVFYDGPPFATGLPHYGHILAGTIKDVIPRFWTMNGYRIRRKWGWDCHGLPLENIIEKRLGLATKKDIEELGIKTFNEAARAAVLEYADDWRRIIPRMGRWVDMDEDYRTMDPAYTESVWWVFKQLHDKGLVYEGFKSMHLCPRCGTTLSNFEVNQGYKDIKDIAVTVKLPLLDEAGNETDTSLLVWTTTPWTLPGNMAAAVHNDHTYVVVEKKDEEMGGLVYFVLAKERAEAVFPDGGYTIVKELKGSELVGKSYEPPFEYYKSQEFEHKENAWKIWHADYVELGEEGTGAVHIAPAFGEDDLTLAQEHNIPIQHHVDADGRFKESVIDFAGQLVKPKDDDDAGVTHLESDISVLKYLQEKGRILKKENITHSYPHCWRCDTPLLNYATTSWFVRVTDLKDKLVAENDAVKWVPKHVGSNRFGKWLEGARDWAVSRQRYWGAPLPIWKNPKSNEYKVFGSLADLRTYVPRSGNTYLLMRHGEAQSNESGVTSSNRDAENPMTIRGQEQVRDAISGLQKKEIDLIIASPYQRTRETAEMVAEALSMQKDAIVFDDRIGEIEMGVLDGKTVDEYRSFIECGETWCNARPEEGESWQDVMTRVGAFLYELESTYKDKTILIVSHNSPLRMMGAVNDGVILESGAFDHDEDGKRYENAEVRELPFVPLPHNDKYELDYHRPYIDAFELIDEDGARLERVPDVFDCWFESGSMPYGQYHYPFENTNLFEPRKQIGYPAQFIAEGLDQTRGWFYSLIVLGTALFDRAPYEHVIVNGLVLAEDGKKMSKKLQNYPDPMELADRVGVDAMRYYLLSSPVVKGEDLSFSEQTVLEIQRKNIGRLHNVLTMYELYAENAAINTLSNHVLDRWISARLGELIKDCTEGFTEYELDRATRPITDFIDDLSVWYVRRSRDRFKSGDTDDARAALSTLRYVLRSLALVMAPSMPFYAEYLWERVRTDNDTESVHLASWPEQTTYDEEVISNMAATREIVRAALEVRAQKGIKVRQPLETLTIKSSLHEEYHALIADEVNVKRVTLDRSLTSEVVLDTELTDDLRREGVVRELIRGIQDARKQMGLSPNDVVALTVDEVAGDVVVEEAKLLRTVGADTLSVSNSLSEAKRCVSVEGKEYCFVIDKK